MDRSELEQHLAKPVRMLQIVVAAMTIGAGGFLAVSAVLHATGNAPMGYDEASLPIVTYLSAGLGAVALVARVVAPGVVTRIGRKRIARGIAPPSPVFVAQDESLMAFLTTDAGRLCQLHLTRTIIAAAIVEGSALLASIAYLIEHTTLSLGMAIVLLVLVAAQIPTRGGMADWIERQLRLIEEDPQRVQ